MNVVILLFDGITALDAVGPYEVLSRLPDTTVRFVAKQPGAYRTDTGALTLGADYAFAEVGRADVVVLPGGPGTRALVNDGEVLDWIRRVHESTTWTTSVCTGALLLGAAGLLQGLRASTHWAARDLLSAYGATVSHDRVVRQGRVITAAGVSAGIDMGLRLAQLTAGDRMARAAKLVIEYDPPASGEIHDALEPDADTVELALGLLRPRESA